MTKRGYSSKDPLRDGDLIEIVDALLPEICGHFVKFIPEDGNSRVCKHDDCQNEEDLYRHPHCGYLICSDCKDKWFRDHGKPLELENADAASSAYGAPVEEKINNA